MCHLSNRLYQTHRGGEVDGEVVEGGREEENERVKEGENKTERNKEKERNGE